MKQQAGFTLIELVAVIVILSLLGAMAVPRFATIQREAEQAAVDGSANAIKSAHSIAIAELKRLPSVTELAARVGGESVVTAVGTGVQVNINGTNRIIPTYTVADCTGVTAAVANIVACVGSLTIP